MAGWHHQLDEQEFEQAREMVKNREAQSATVHGGCKESNTTERLNNKYPPPKSPQQIKRPPEGTHGHAQGVGPALPLAQLQVSEATAHLRARVHS